MKSDGNIICSALMGNNKGLSSNDVFGQKLLSSRANGVGHANGNTDSAGEGHKLENVDSGNRHLLLIRWTVGTAGGGEDRKNLKCLGNSMHIVSGTEKRPIFAHRPLLWTYPPPSGHYLAIT